MSIPASSDSRPSRVFVLLFVWSTIAKMYRIGRASALRTPKKGANGYMNQESSPADGKFERTPRAAVERLVESISAEKHGKDMVDERLLHRIVMTTLDARITEVAYLTERSPVLVADNKRGKLIWEDAHEEDEMDLRLNFLHIRGSPDESPLQIEYRRPIQSKKNPNRKNAFVNIVGQFYQVRTEKNKVSNIVLVEFIN